MRTFTSPSWFLVACLSGIIGITACSTPTKYSREADAWKGRKATELVARRGTPSKTTQLPGGGRVYEYRDIDPNAQYSYSSKSSQAYALQAAHYCKITFISDENDVIQNASYEGTTCDKTGY